MLLSFSSDCRSLQLRVMYDLEEPNLEEIQNLQQIAAYQEVGTNTSQRATGEDEEQTVEFDDVEEDDETATTSSTTMEPPSCRPSQPETVDTSEPIMHKRSRGCLVKIHTGYGFMGRGVWTIPVKL